MLLWDVLARSSAVLVAAALINTALRGRFAALRHAVWACGLAGALAVAPLSWVLPSWHVPLLPALAAAPESTAAVAAAADVVLEPASTVPELASRTASRVLSRVPSRVAERVPSRIAETGSVPSRRAPDGGRRARRDRRWRQAGRESRCAARRGRWSDVGQPAQRRASVGCPAVRRLGARHAAAPRTPGHRQPRDVPGAAHPGDHVGAVGRNGAPPGAALRRAAHALRAGRIDHHADGRRLSPADGRLAGRGGRLARRAGDVGPPARARPHPPPRLPDAARRQHHLRALLDEPAGLVRRPRPAARARAGL